MTLKKAELLDLAEANDVDVDESNTVAEIKDALDEAGVDYSGNGDDTEAEETEEPEAAPGVDDGVIAETKGNEANRQAEADAIAAAEKEGESDDGAS